MPTWNDALPDAVTGDYVTSRLLVRVPGSPDQAKEMLLSESTRAAGDGAAATPGFAFQAAPATGMYRTAGGDLGVSVGGVARIFMRAGGNVGIGTTAPDAALTVSGAVSVGAGSVGAPTYAFAGDLNTGMWSPAPDTVAFSTGGVERMRIDSGGGVGIGTSTPGAYRLNVNGTQSTNAIFESTQSASYIQLKSATGSAFLSTPVANAVGFHTSVSATERMRIHASGGVSINNATDPGAGNLSVTGSIVLAVGAAATPSYTFAGDLNTGMYSAAADTLGFATGGIERLVIEAVGNLRPGSDNTLSLGTGPFRWSQVFAATGTINTSDEREKEWRGGMTQAEREAALAIVAELGFYRWSDAVAEKDGAARLHFGARAQRVWAIMAEHELIDPIGKDGRPGATPYAFLCYDEWEDMYQNVPVDSDDEGNVDPDAKPERLLLRAAGNRFGLRLDQLTLFLLAAAFPAA